MLNEELFMKNMVAIGEMYGKPLSPEMLQMYYMVLEEMTDNQFKQAVKVIMRTHVWNTLPKPAEFIEAIKPDTDSQAIMAWQKIENTMARVGAYKTVIFDDPLIHGFIQGFEGCWPGLCSKTIEEMIWIRKDFEKYYKAISPDSIDCRPLIGISEGENITRGIEHKEAPVYIGDLKQAQLLIEHGKEAAETIDKLGIKEG
jgi:hypothetical protein